MRITFYAVLAALSLALGLAAGLGPAAAGSQLATAIGGYDAVSYQDGEPARGEARFNHFWNGAVWYFASDENRKAFAEAPETYAPQYDGYCAFAASRGYKAPGDPLVYDVVDGKLYLQVHPRAQELWQEDVAGNIAKADEVWPRIHPF